MTRQLLTRSRSQLCAELEYDIWNFCSLNPFRLNQGLKTLFRLAFDRQFVIRQDRFSNAFSKADKRLAKMFFRKRSYFGNMIVMKRKLRFFFGYITKTEMSKRVAQLIYFQRQNPHLGGFENLFRVFERRLDFLSMRLRFTFNLKQARNFVIHGNMSVNNIIQMDPSFLVALGDVISPSTIDLRGLFYTTQYIFWYGEYICHSGILRGPFLYNLFKYMLLRHKNSQELILESLAKHLETRLNSVVYNNFIESERFFLQNWRQRLSVKREFLQSFGFNSIIQRERLLTLFEKNRSKSFLSSEVLKRSFGLIDYYNMPSNEHDVLPLGDVDLSFLRYFYIFYFMNYFLKNVSSYFNMWHCYLEFNRLSSFFIGFNDELYSFKKKIALRAQHFNTFKIIIRTLIYIQLLSYIYNQKAQISNLKKYNVNKSDDNSMSEISSYFNQPQKSFEWVLINSKVDYYKDKINIILSLLKGLISHFYNSELGNSSMFFFQNYLISGSISNKKNKYYSLGQFFHRILFFFTRTQQLSWGYFLLVFREGLMYDLGLNSLQNFYFSYRNCLRLWSVSQIERMYNILDFFEKAAAKRQSFSSLKKREYSFFLVTTNSSIESYFFELFKNFTASNYFFFVYLRSDQREEDSRVDAYMDMSQSVVNLSSDLDLLLEESHEEDNRNHLEDDFSEDDFYLSDEEIN